MFIRKLAERGWSISQFLTLVTLTGGLLASGQTALATDYFWAAPVSGDGSVATNWTPNGVPSTTADSTNFNLGSSGYTVTAPLIPNVSLQLGALNIGTDNVTFNFNGGTIFYNSISLGQKSGDIANMTLLNAFIESTYGLNGAVGDAAGSTANVAIGNSQLAGGLSVTSIGNSGTATVNVVHGFVEAEYLGFAANSLGTVAVDGAKSTWFGVPNQPLYLGDAGNGSLTVQDGASASNQGYQVYIANQAGTQGTVTVTGTGSSWTNRDALYVGYGGTGAMNVTNGATATPQYTVDVGYLPGSTGTLAIGGAGSKFTAIDPLTVGTQGTGSISITAGGALSAKGTTIGDQPGSHGSITVDGAGSSFTNTTNRLVVGNNGTGSLALTGGASATIGGTFVGSGAGGSGQITADGAGTQLAGAVWLFGAGAGGASLSVTNGASFSGDLQYRDGSIGPLNATFDGKGTTANTTITLDFGTGSLKIQNGAVVTTPNNGLYIGVIATTVSGANTQWNVNPTDLNAGGGIVVGNFTGSGQLTISNGGTVNLGVVASTAFGSASVEAGSVLDILQGTLNASSVGNSGILHDDGTINANVFSNGAASVLSGSGIINGKLEFAGTLAPGNSPGTLTVGPTTWYAGGVFKLAINDANGIAGGTSGWGLLSVIGSAELNSIPHTIALESLTSGDTPGAISNFDPTHNYSWTFVTATGEVFNPGGFTIDTSGFDNPIYGHFSVTAGSHTLSLNYTAPEPSTFVLARLGVVMGCAVRLRRRTDKRKT